MKGTAKTMIDGILSKYAQGEVLTERLIETKLYLRGIKRTSLTSDTPDDPALISRLNMIDRELSALYNK